MSKIKLPNLSIEKQRPPERYTKHSRKHPAKMYTPIAQWCIEKYTKPGDWILDPMAGIGTVPIEAAWMGRSAIGVEYEEEWFTEFGKNIRKAEITMDMKVAAYIGDARYMSTFITEEGPFDMIMFSPPYGPVISHKRKHEGVHASALLKKIRDEEGEWPVSKETLRRYANEWRRDHPEGHYSQDPDNVGNMSTEDYETAMIEIYSECIKMVKEDGVMVLVTRNPCKDWKQIPLDLMTIDMAQRAGWIYKERWYAPIYRYSYWISKYKQTCEAKGLKSVVPDYDDILVFETP